MGRKKGKREGSPEERLCLTTAPEAEDSSSSATLAPPAPPSSSTFFVAFACAIAVLLGYDIGVMSGAIRGIASTLGLSVVQRQLVVGSLNFVSGIGALAAGALADTVGRRSCLAASMALYTLGSLIMVSAGAFGTMLGGRIVVGLSVGLGMTVVPLYISELVSPPSRGRLTACFELAICSGLLLGYASNLALFGLAPGVGWRVMLALPLPLAVGAACGAGRVLPPSPRWLLARGQEAEARTVLATTHTATEVEEAVSGVLALLAQERADAAAVARGGALGGEGGGAAAAAAAAAASSDGVLSVLCGRRGSPGKRRALAIGLLVCFMQQANGSEAAVYYVPKIMEQAGVADPYTQQVGALVVGLFKAGFVGFGLWLVDRVGRRPLLLWSCAVVTLSLVALAGCLAAKAPPAAVGAALCAFTGAFAVGEGPVTWVLVSEIFPMRLRGRAVALAMCLNRMTSGAVSMTFLSLSEALGGAGGAFGMFAAVSALHTALVWALVPETKGRSLEEIEASFGATEMGRGGCGSSSSSSSSSATVADSGGGDGNGGDGDDAEKGGGAGAHAHGGGHGGGHGIDPGREITPQKAWVHLVKGNVGPGCLSLAAGASQAGEAGSLVLGVVIVAVCLAGWHMIWQCKVHTQASGARTFGDIGDRAFGRRGRDTIEFFVMFTQLAVCCVFFSFFAVNIHAALPAGGALDWLTPATIMLLALPFFLYVGSLKDLKVLVPFSQAAIAALLLGFAIVLYYCADWLRRGQPRAPLAPSLGGATLFFGTAVYALEGVALLLPIENAMGADARGQFGSVMNWAMLAIVASFVLLTAVPLAAFGAVKSSSLTAELGAHYGGEALVTVCNLLLVLNVALTYPLQFLPTCQVVEQWVRGMARARPQLLHGGGGGGGGGGGRGGSGDSAEGGEADLAAPAGPLCITDGARGSINSAGGSSDSAARGHEVAGVGNGGGVTTTADASDAPACLRSCPCTLSPRALEHLQTYPWLRAYMVVFTMLVAASVPDLGLLISLFGSVASSTLGLILPPLMYVRLVPGQTAASTAACYSMCAFGVLGAVGGAVSSLQGIAKAYGK